MQVLIIVVAAAIIIGPGMEEIRKINMLFASILQRFLHSRCLSYRGNRCGGRAAAAGIGGGTAAVVLVAYDIVIVDMAVAVILAAAFVAAAVADMIGLIIAMIIISIDMIKFRKIDMPFTLIFPANPTLEVPFVSEPSLFPMSMEAFASLF